MDEEESRFGCRLVGRSWSEGIGEQGKAELPNDQPTMNNPYHRPVKSISAFLAGLVAAASALLWFGGIFQGSVLKQALIGFPIFPATGLTLFLNSAALLLGAKFDRQGGIEAPITVSRLFSAIAITVSGLTLVEYGLGRQIAGPQFLIPALQQGEASPFVGLMPPNTALILFLTSAAIPFRQSINRYWLVETAYLTSLLIGFLGLLGYLFNIRSFYSITFYPAMPLSTVLVSLALNVSALLNTPHRGLLGVTFSQAPGGHAIRRLLPVVLIGQLLLGGIVLTGRSNELFEFHAGIGLLIATNVALFVSFLYWSAKSLNRSDAERKEAEEHVRELNVSLKKRVDELETLFDIAPVGIAVAEEPTVRQVLLNPTLAEAGSIGRSEAEANPGDTSALRHVSVDSHSAGTLLSSLSNLMLKAIDNGESLPPEQLEVPANETPARYYVGYCAPLHTEDGVIRGALGILAEITSLKEAQHHASRLAAIVESSYDAIIAKTLDGTITSWNRAAENLYGFTQEEAIGSSIFLIVPADRKIEVHDFLERLQRGEKIEPLETKRQRKDGRLIDISLTISPIRSPEGRIVGASAIARDITQRKHAEQELIKSQERFRQMADAMPQMVWTTNTQGDPDYFNQRWIAFTGLSEPELVEQWLTCFHPEDRLATQQRFYQALQTVDVFETECRLQRHDGQYFWHLVRAVPTWDDTTETWEWYGTCTNIDDTKRTKEQIAQVSSTLLSVLHALPDIIFVVDSDSHIEWSNPVADRFMEICFPSQQLPGGIQGCLDRALKTGEAYLPATFEGIMEFQWDNQSRSLLPQIIPMEKSPGRIFGAVVLLQDVTQFRLLDQVKTNLLATASHELKSPLTSIRTSLHLLCNSSTGKLDNRQAELADIACKELERLQETLYCLLDLARFDSDSYQLQYELISPAELVRTAVTHLENDAENAGITIQSEIGEPVPSIEVDRTRIEHAIENLLRNAIQYSPAGMTVTTGVRAESENEVAIYVLDQGAGISDELQQSIFNRFFRIPGTYKSGSGLGLSIAQEFVKAHHGRLRVQSQPDEGSEFTITLPVRQAAPEYGSKSQYQGSSDSSFASDWPPSSLPPDSSG